jgi:hypothetical protein
VVVLGVEEIVLVAIGPKEGVWEGGPGLEEEVGGPEK